MKLRGRIIKIGGAFLASLLLTWVVEAAVFGHPGLMMRIDPTDLNPFNSWIETGVLRNLSLLDIFSMVFFSESEEEEVVIVHQETTKPTLNYKVINDLNPFLSWLDSFGISNDKLEIKEFEEEDEEVLVVPRSEARQMKQYMAIRKFLL